MCLAMTSLTIFERQLKSNGEAALVIAQDLVSVPSVLPDNRSVTGNEIRLAQLFKEGAIQPNDRFHFSRSIKTYMMVTLLTSQWARRWSYVLRRNHQRQFRTNRIQHY